MVEHVASPDRRGLCEAESQAGREKGVGESGLGVSKVVLVRPIEMR